MAIKGNRTIVPRPGMKPQKVEPRSSSETRIKSRDLRRVWYVIGAIEFMCTSDEYLEPTLASLQDATGIGKTTILKIVDRVNSDEFFDLQVGKNSEGFYIENWGFLSGSRAAIVEKFRTFHESLWDELS